MNKKGIIIVSASVLTLTVAGVCGGFAWKNYNKYEVKQGRVTVELGEEINQNPADYLNASEKALKETKLDTSKVDTMTAGKYHMKASWKNHAADIIVEIKDTTKPEITLTEKNNKIMVGEELKATDLVKKVDDLAGIKKVSFQENQIELKNDSKNSLDKIGLKFDKAGTQEVTFIAEDINGNKATKKITVKVVEDYLAHISGFKDITMTQGETPDWLAGIVKDEKIAELTADTAGVDTHTPGEYTLKYIIKGDDKETTLEQTVKVTVNEKPKPVEQPKKNNSSNKSSGGSSSSSSGGGSSVSSSSGGGSSSGNSSGGNSGSSETWSTSGTKTDEGFIDGPDGNTSEGFTFEIP